MLQKDTSAIEIVVNGQACAVPSGQTILGLVESLGLKPDRVAVEMDRHIVKRAEWTAAPLRPGVKIEIVQFVGGG
jgi:thiamine biosynthesis protein ThiS